MTGAPQFFAFLVYKLPSSVLKREASAVCGEGSPAWKFRVKARTGEHNHSDQVIQITETAGRTNDQLDFVVGSLDPSIGEPVPRCGNDGIKVALDLLAQVPENRDPAPLNPVHPRLEQGSNLVRAGFEGQTQVFLPKVGAVKPWVSLC